jgi:hypothetical protein
MRIAPLLLSCCSLLLLAGCVEHETRILGHAPAAGAEGAVVIGSARTSIPPGAPGISSDRSPLPRETVVSVWQRDGEGVIAREDLVVRTTLPWWQRFPCDYASDLLPIDARVTAEHTIAPRPITPRTRSALDREAAAAGYAHP